MSIELECFRYSRHEVEKYAQYLTNISPNILNKYQIFCDSNFHLIDKKNVLDESKIRICWIHSSPEQNEQILNSINQNNKPLADGGWNKFHKIVFVSNYQMEYWIKKYNIPRSYCTVIKHAIKPIKYKKKSKDKITLVYHSNPNRGLLLLVDVFEKLCEEYDNIELKVYSCFNYKNLNHVKSVLDMENKYKQSDLYKRIEKHPKIYNSGCVSNKKLNELLSSSHIFAYPNIFIETFCISLLEAMSFGLLCVHPNYGSLSETSANWTMMYDYDEEVESHKKLFYYQLKKAIEIVNDSDTQEHLQKQKKYVDYLFNEERRTKEWNDFLEQLKNIPLKKVHKNIILNYKL
jgi:glycosyltransferase involved in cell wall biosynthesis